MKKFSYRWIIWLVLLFVSVLPLLDLLHTGLPVTHDGKDHVARIANFYQSLTEGILVPRWAGNLNWGYGHPVMMFLYPLPSYMGSAFHAFGFSLVDSVKLVFAFGFIASVISMYMFVSYGLGPIAGILAAILYGFAPYRFVDMYVRGAIGEHIAFIFPPLIFLGLWRLAKNHSIHPLSILLVIGGMSGLLLSHNAVSLMMLPVIGLYLWYVLWSKASKRRLFLLSSIGSLLFGFILSAFFWLPAFIEGKYTLREIVTKGEFTSRFVDSIDFINPAWAYGTVHEISKFLGFSHLIVLLLALLFFRSMRKATRLLVVGILLYIIVSLALMTESAALIWKTVSLLQKFQFPWRFLHVTTFLLPILGAVVVSQISRKQRIYVVILLSVIAILGSRGMWQAKEYVQMPDEYFTSVYNGTTDTGESAPIWSVRFMEKAAVSPIEIIRGKNATITIGKRTSTVHLYAITAKEPVRIVENTLYFPNWEVLVDTTSVPLEFQDPSHRGLMTFDVPAGEHSINVRFSDTKLRSIANGISLGGVIILLGFLGTMRVWQKRT